MSSRSWGGDDDHDYHTKVVLRMRSQGGIFVSTCRYRMKFQNGMINHVCDCRFHKQGTGTRIRNNVPMKGSHVFRVVIQEPRMGFGNETRILG